MIDFVLEISYPCNAEIEEEVQSRLFLTASTGSSSIDVDGTTVVTAYFDSADSRAKAMQVLGDVDARFLFEDRARVDWLEKYQQSLEPIFIGQSFIVAPDASLIGRDEDKLRILVPQEQAFGTGSHETTSLCMEMLEALPVRGRRGLDIGSGSGILAIAMHRLGASKVLAFDNDVDAYGPLRDNRMRNRVPENALPLFIGSIESLRGGRFDVITMNIVPDVIIAMLPDVIARMSERASVIVSGVLNERRDDVVKAVGALHLAGERSKGEWWCGCFQRRASR
ncbi:MAG TPA: 50S ribosomal protein L11 methyltransferase [Thermoanaerobaculia bacterium]